VLNLDALSTNLTQMGIENTMAAACESEKLSKYLLDEIVKTGRSAKLAGFQCPRKILLTPEAFTEDNGLLTPSFKLKRSALQAKYRTELDKMYEGAL
jgi:long-chain acyl-CoA synthetase